MISYEIEKERLDRTIFDWLLIKGKNSHSWVGHSARIDT